VRRSTKPSSSSTLCSRTSASLDRMRLSGGDYSPLTLRNFRTDLSVGLDERLSASIPNTNLLVKPTPWDSAHNMRGSTFQASLPIVLLACFHSSLPFVSFAALHGVLDGVAWALLMMSIGLYISLVLSQNVSFPQYIPRTAALAGITKRRWMRRPSSLRLNLGLRS
jgi:hypothetical protein